MAVHIDEVTTQVDVAPSSRTEGAGGSPAPDAAQLARLVQAALTRVLELERRTRAEGFDD